MIINEEAMKNPNRLADDVFIEAAIQDVEEQISYIEERFNTVLIGDRNSFSQAREDWKNMTVAQVAFAVSAWKAGIHKRYSDN